MEGNIIDFSPLLQALVGLLIAVLTALATFGVNWVRNKVGLEKMSQDDIVRGYLNEAIKNAVLYAASKVPTTVRLGEDRTFIAEAVTYIMESVPDALERFGITEANLVKLIESRLPALEAEINSVKKNE